MGATKTDRWVSISVAARHSGVTRTEIVGLADRGVIKHKVDGSSVRYNLQDCQDLYRRTRNERLRRQAYSTGGDVPFYSLIAFVTIAFTVGVTS